MTTHPLQFRAVVFGVATAAVLAASAPSSAAVITVGPGQSIQTAIQSAAAGDVIEVQPGNYAEAINFLGKKITVIGVGGPDVTTIDASGLNTSVVSMMSGEPTGTRLEGFTITGGAGSGLASNVLGGGGIAVTNSAKPTIRRCAIVGNSVSAAGGPGSPYVFGGGIATWAKGEPVVEH